MPPGANLPWGMNRGVRGTGQPRTNTSAVTFQIRNSQQVKLIQTKNPKKYIPSQHLRISEDIFWLGSWPQWLQDKQLRGYLWKNSPLLTYCVSSAKLKFKRQTSSFTKVNGENFLGSFGGNYFQGTVCWISDFKAKQSFTTNLCITFKWLPNHMDQFITISEAKLLSSVRLAFSSKIGKKWHVNIVSTFHRTGSNGYFVPLSQGGFTGEQEEIISDF